MAMRKLLNTGGSKQTTPRNRPMMSGYHMMPDGEMMKDSEMPKKDKGRRGKHSKESTKTMDMDE